MMTLDEIYSSTSFDLRYHEELFLRVALEDGHTSFYCFDYLVSKGYNPDFVHELILKVGQTNFTKNVKKS